MKRIMTIIAGAVVAGLCAFGASKASVAVLPEKPAVAIQGAITLAEQHLKKTGVDLSEHYVSQAAYGQLPNEDKWSWTVVWSPTGKGKGGWHHVAVYMDKTAKDWTVK